MHEVGIAQSLLAALEARLPGLPPGALRTVRLRLGRLSAVDPDSLAFAFECLARDTRFAGARLACERVPIRVRCDACGHEGPVEDLVFRCARCGSERTQLTAGHELEMCAVDIADGAASAVEEEATCTIST